MSHIIVVDDNLNLMSALKEVLATYGHTVTLCSDLGEGLREVRSSSFDVLIADKNLGTHRGVHPLLDYMQEEKASVPVVMWSAEDGRRACQELYCTDFIEKGGRGDFVEKLEKVLGKYIPMKPQPRSDRV